LEYILKRNQFKLQV